MANESNQAKGPESKTRGGQSKLREGFKPSVPLNYVRPKPVPVPAKSR